VDRYRNVDFSAYIDDGTIVGHFVIDEPQFASRWGGKVIPQATVEAAAAYSKQIWPTLPTIVNAPAHWLAASTSGFHGNYPGKWAMSAAELRTYGAALLSQSHVCGFGMWEYRSAYYDRADVKSAMADLSARARSHAKTSCRQ